MIITTMIIRIVWSGMKNLVANTRLKYSKQACFVWTEMNVRMTYHCNSSCWSASLPWGISLPPWQERRRSDCQAECLYQTSRATCGANKGPGHSLAGFVRELNLWDLCWKNRAMRSSDFPSISNILYMDKPYIPVWSSGDCSLCWF